MPQLIGELEWGVKRDREGHRDYDIMWLVEADHVMDGPLTIMLTPGLPLPGSLWAMGNDIDAWAFCKPDMTVSQVLTKEPNKLWTVSQKFSTRPDQRCQDNTIENPLDEPFKISGNYRKFSREFTHGRDGLPFKYSNHERIRGQLAEFDEDRPTIRVEFNSLLLPPVVGRVNWLNDSPMWGLLSRCIKLSEATWTRLQYGTCNYYFNTVLGFDANENTWDRKVWDKGNTILIPTLDPDEDHPDHPGKTYKEFPELFIPAVNAYTNQPLGEVFLNGKGQMLGPDDDPFEITLEAYHEFNMHELGLPEDINLNT